MPENRAKTGRFKSGQSGNPGGRPKRTAEQQSSLEKIRTLTENAARVLRRILEDDTVAPSIKLRAVEIVLDRTYGKPQQPVEVARPKAEMAEEIAAVLAERQRELKREH